MIDSVVLYNVIFCNIRCSSLLYNGNYKFFSNLRNFLEIFLITFEDNYAILAI